MSTWGMHSSDAATHWSQCSLPSAESADSPLINRCIARDRAKGRPWPVWTQCGTLQCRHTQVAPPPSCLFTRWGPAECKPGTRLDRRVSRCRRCWSSCSCPPRTTSGICCSSWEMCLSLRIPSPRFALSSQSILLRGFTLPSTLRF